MHEHAAVAGVHAVALEVVAGDGDARRPSVETAELAVEDLRVAQRDAVGRSAEANRDGQKAKFAADTEIAEADRDYQMKVADYKAAVQTQKAQADLAYDLQKYTTEQGVKREEVQIQVVDREMQTDVQEREIVRKERELMATIQKPADAERYKVETLADAERAKREREAAGEAAAIESVGKGEAAAAAEGKKQPEPGEAPREGPGGGQGDGPRE